MHCQTGGQTDRVVVFFTFMFRYGGREALATMVTRVNATYAATLRVLNEVVTGLSCTVFIAPQILLDSETKAKIQARNRSRFWLRLRNSDMVATYHYISTLCIFEGVFIITGQLMKYGRNVCMSILVLILLKTWRILLRS